jgi:hypothetical protein
MAAVLEEPHGAQDILRDALGCPSSANAAEHDAPLAAGSSSTTAGAVSEQGREPARPAAQLLSLGDAEDYEMVGACE